MIWKPIDGFPDYEVSDEGLVRSWKSLNGQGRAREPHLLKLSPFVDKPYLRVSLFRDGKGTLRRVHHLVLEAFVGPCPDGMEGCHNDGDPANNRIGNLRWDTVRGNADDRSRHGTQVRGESSGKSILTEEQAREIKEHVRSGLWRRGDGRRFRKKFGVCDTAISQVKNNITWNHV